MTEGMPYLANSPGAVVRALEFDAMEKGFRVFNPSVAVLKDRVVVAARASNVEKDDLTSKFFLSAGQREMRNDILFGELDADLELTNQRKVDLVETSTGRKLPARGFEDLRIVASTEGRLEAMCCVPSADYLLKPKGELGFGRYYSTKAGRLRFSPGFAIERATSYDSPFDRRMEKNWSPFYWQGKFCVVYQWNPFIALELEEDCGLSVAKACEASTQLRDARGSSQGVPTLNGFLFVIHRKKIIEGMTRFSHQFVEIGADLRPRRISAEFGLMSPSVLEYCAGLARVGNHWLLTFGVSDAKSHVLKVDEAVVEETLVPFTEPVNERVLPPEGALEALALSAAQDFPTEPPVGFKDRLKLHVGRLLGAIRR